MKLTVGTSHGIYSGDKRLDRMDLKLVLACRAVKIIIETSGGLLAGTRAGVYRADLAGLHWSLSGLEEYGIRQIKKTAVNDLIAGTTPAAVFKSSDEGLNWQELKAFSEFPEAQNWCLPSDPPRPAQACAIVTHASDPNRLWVGVEVGGIMHSADGGAQWTLGFPGGIPDIHTMVAQPNDPDLLLVSTGYGRFDGLAEMVEGNAGVFRSTNAGADWSYIWQDVSPRYARPMCIDSRSPYALTVASVPTPSSRYQDEGGAQAMLFQSLDQGETWQSLCDVSHTPSPVNFNALTPNPEFAGGVLLGSDNGEIWSVSPSGTWNQLVSGLPAVLSIHAH